MAGLVLGLVSMIGGSVLFLNGVAGSTNWTAKILGNESTITDAAPGAILFVIGLFVVIVTRFKVKTDHIPGKYGERKLVILQQDSPFRDDRLG
jgi:hypothetical protein